MSDLEAGKPVCVHGHSYGLHPADEPPDCGTFAPVTEHRAEAVAAERARIRAAVEELPQTHGYGEVRRWVDVAAVLAIIDDHA